MAYHMKTDFSGYPLRRIFLKLKLFAKQHDAQRKWEAALAGAKLK